MQLDYLQRILGHVKKGLTCPRCQEAFGSAEINVLAIGNKKIDLAIKCPHCNTDARISAEVTTQKMATRKGLNRKPGKSATKISTKTHVTPENVAELRRGIAGMSANDIAHLDPEKE